LTHRVSRQLFKKSPLQVQEKYFDFLVQPFSKLILQYAIPFNDEVDTETLYWNFDQNFFNEIRKAGLLIATYYASIDWTALFNVWNDFSQIVRMFMRKMTENNSIDFKYLWQREITISEEHCTICKLEKGKSHTHHHPKKGTNDQGNIASRVEQRKDQDKNDSKSKASTAQAKNTVQANVNDHVQSTVPAEKQEKKKVEENNSEKNERSYQPNIAVNKNVGVQKENNSTERKNIVQNNTSESTAQDENRTMDSKNERMEKLFPEFERFQSFFKEAVSQELNGNLDVSKTLYKKAFMVVVETARSDDSFGSLTFKTAFQKIGISLETQENYFEGIVHPFSRFVISVLAVASAKTSEQNLEAEDYFFSIHHGHFVEDVQRAGTSSKLKTIPRFVLF